MAKKYTKPEKLAILQEADRHGVTKVLEKYALSPATYYYWRKKWRDLGEEGLLHGADQDSLRELEELRQENEMLKQMMAEKELEGKLKDDLLKKKFSWYSKGNLSQDNKSYGLSRDKGLVRCGITGQAGPAGSVCEVKPNV